MVRRVSVFDRQATQEQKNCFVRAAETAATYVSYLRTNRAPADVDLVGAQPTAMGGKKFNKKAATTFHVAGRPQAFSFEYSGTGTPEDTSCGSTS